MSDGCPGCGALKGHGHRRKVAPPEERIAALEKLADYWKERTVAACKLERRHRELAVMWHGKFSIAKHENNKLRQRLWRQTREEKHEPQVPSSGV